MKGFDGTDLQACLGFPVPTGAVPSFTVTHVGEDGWTPRWIRILLDDSTWIECPGRQHFGTVEGASRLFMYLNFLLFELGFNVDNSTSSTGECVPFKPA